MRIGLLTQWRSFREPAIWSAALVFLFCADPGRSTFSLCVFKLLGFSHCPGCGLGHAIHYALHLEWRPAWQAHPLGIPAALLLLRAVFTSLFTSLHPSLPAWTSTNYS